jgi:hypothetical protein
MEKIQIKKGGFKSGVENWEKAITLKVASSKVKILKVI